MAAAETPGPAADLAKLGQELLAQQRAICERIPDFVMPHPSLKKLVGPAASVSEAAVNEGLAACATHPSPVSAVDAAAIQYNQDYEAAFTELRDELEKSFAGIDYSIRLKRPRQRQSHAANPGRGAQPGEGGGECRPGRAHRDIEERLQAPPPPGHTRNAGAGRARRSHRLNSSAPRGDAAALPRGSAFPGARQPADWRVVLLVQIFLEPADCALDRVDLRKPADEKTGSRMILRLIASALEARDTLHPQLLVAQGLIEQMRPEDLTDEERAFLVAASLFLHDQRLGRSGQRNVHAAAPRRSRSLTSSPDRQQAVGAISALSEKLPSKAMQRVLAVVRSLVKAENAGLAVHIEAAAAGARRRRASARGR